VVASGILVLVLTVILLQLPVKELDVLVVLSRYGRQVEKIQSFKIWL
jgi:hypothetical protein